MTDNHGNYYHIHPDQSCIIDQVGTSGWDIPSVCCTKHDGHPISLLLQAQDPSLRLPSAILPIKLSKSRGINLIVTWLYWKDNPATTICSLNTILQHLLQPGEVRVPQTVLKTLLTYSKNQNSFVS